MLSLLHRIAPILLESSIAVVVLFFLARLMGKKQISQLSFFDYIVGITIGSIAADISMDREIPSVEGITAIAVWSLFSILIAFLSQKSMICRRFLDGTPTILIQNGRILKKNLTKSRFTLNDLLEELRIKDIFDVGEVDFAILETNGKLSVLKKPQEQNPTAKDLNLVSPYKGLGANLIIDGKILKTHLATAGFDETRLLSELNKRGISSPEQVLIACVFADGTLFIDLKGSEPQGLNQLQ